MAFPEFDDLGYTPEHRAKWFDLPIDAVDLDGAVGDETDEPKDEPKLDALTFDTFTEEDHIRAHGMGVSL